MDETYHLYVIGTRRDGKLVAPCKVGITNNWKARLRAVQTGSANKVDFAFVFNMPSRGIARDVERCFHETLGEHRMSGEWFDLCPSRAVALVCMAIQACIKSQLPDVPAEDLQTGYELMRASEAMALLGLPTHYNSFEQAD